MPGQLKEDVVRPKLKKKSLDFEEYQNFRPINLKIVGKIIERAVAVQVKNYITDNDLDESLQVSIQAPTKRRDSLTESTEIYPLYMRN